MLFDAPVDILDMRKCSISSATRQLTRTASRSVLDAVNSMNSALSGSRTELGTGGESTPKEGSIERPAPFRRFYSSPQLIPKKSPQSPPSSSPPMDDSTRRSSTLPRQSVVSIALAQRMRLLSNLSLSLTNLEPTKD